MSFEKSRYSLKDKKVWVAGHRGLVGSALLRCLKKETSRIVTVNRDALDLRDQANVRRWMAANKPDVIILAAARVGGIGANAAGPADFLYDNLMIEANVIHAAAEIGVEKLLFLGSSCIYPKEAAQPIKEEALLTGPLEPTNEAYALAKIAGIKLCQGYRAQYGHDFISAMPCNLYGPGDRFDEERSHVIPALMLKALRAKQSGAALKIWGTGQPLRELLHVDDLADALVFLLKNYSGAMPVNIGSGEEISIADLAHKIGQVAGFTGTITFDLARPDGTMRKLLDSGRIREAGWAPAITLEKGLAETYAWFIAQQDVKHAA